MEVSRKKPSDFDKPSRPGLCRWSALYLILIAMSAIMQRSSYHEFRGSQSCSVVMSRGKHVPTPRCQERLERVSAVRYTVNIGVLMQGLEFRVSRNCTLMPLLWRDSMQDTESTYTPRPTRKERCRESNQVEIGAHSVGVSDDSTSHTLPHTCRKIKQGTVPRGIRASRRSIGRIT